MKKIQKKTDNKTITTAKNKKIKWVLVEIFSVITLFALAIFLIKIRWR